MFSNLLTYVSHSVTVSVHCVEVLPWFGHDRLSVDVS